MRRAGRSGAGRQDADERVPERGSGSRGRRLVVPAAVLLFVMVGADLARPPDRQLSARVVVAGIGLYHVALSPVLTWLGVRCRFRPTCSVYAREAVERFGSLRGGWLAVRRLLRCGPWTPAGTFDPAPPREQGTGNRAQ